MELLLLLVILPAVQDQNHTREWLKNAIRAWCSAAAWILDLRSYLFGDTTEDVPAEGNDAAEPPVAEQPAEPVQAPPAVPPAAPRPNPVQEGQGLAAAHQALLQREGPVGFQPYKRPKLFPLMVITIYVTCTLTILSEFDKNKTFD